MIFFCCTSSQFKIDLRSVDVSIDEEDQAIILLSSLTKAYEGISDTLMYGKETITMSELRSVLSSKEMQKKGSSSIDNRDVDALFVRGRATKKFNKGARKRSKSKGKGKG